jgi:hypothetical protein
MFEVLGLDLDDLDHQLLIGSLFTDHNRNHAWRHYSLLDALLCPFWDLQQLE